MWTDRASTRNGPRGNQSMTCAPSHCVTTSNAVSQWNAMVTGSYALAVGETGCMGWLRQR